MCASFASGDVKGGKQMKETIGMRALSMLLAALLVSGTIVPAVSADCVKNPPGKTGTNDG